MLSEASEVLKSIRAELGVDQSKELPMKTSEDFCPDPRSRIIVGSSQESIYEIDEIQEKGYEALLSAIIDKIKPDESLFGEQIKQKFHNYVESEDTKRVQEQLLSYIKENGLDETQIQKDRELIEKQKEEIAGLKSTITDLESRVANEKQQMECVASNVDKKSEKGGSEKRRIEELEKENSDLKKNYNEIYDRYSDLEQQYTKKQNEENTCSYHLDIPCSEKNLFPNEMEDYLYMLLYSKIKEEHQNLPKNKEDERCRKRDVLEKLVGEKNSKRKKRYLTRKENRLKIF